MEKEVCHRSDLLCVWVTFFTRLTHRAYSRSSSWPDPGEDSRVVWEIRGSDKSPRLLWESGTRRSRRSCVWRRRKGHRPNWACPGGPWGCTAEKPDPGLKITSSMCWKKGHTVTVRGAICHNGSRPQRASCDICSKVFPLNVEPPTLFYISVRKFRSMVVARGGRPVDIGSFIKMSVAKLADIFSDRVPLAQIELSLLFVVRSFYSNHIFLPVIRPICIPLSPKYFPAIPAASAPKENPIMCRKLVDTPAAPNHCTNLTSTRAALGVFLTADIYLQYIKQNIIFIRRD